MELHIFTLCSTHIIIMLPKMFVERLFDRSLLKMSFPPARDGCAIKIR